MILTESDAVYAADKFIDYYTQFNRIDDYLRHIKEDRGENRSGYLPGFGADSDMFDVFDMHPNDMNFQVHVVDTDAKIYSKYNQWLYSETLNLTASNPIEEAIPGRTHKWIVVETNTDKVVGVVRFGSPTINSKPRNEWLGSVPELTRFNRHAIMGFIIVPTQPFGFNYLGGKLLALLCCSHQARETLNSKYDADICLFETTSLYGSTKSSSQYDGLKPYLRYKGLTQSDFTPLLHDNVFKDLNKWFITRNNDQMLVKEDASSRKLKTQQRMIAVIQKSLQGEKLEDFKIETLDDMSRQYLRFARI